MITPNQHLNQLLSDSGVSKIIYALVMPETEKTIDAVLDGASDHQPGGRQPRRTRWPVAGAVIATVVQSDRYTKRNSHELFGYWFGFVLLSEKLLRGL